ncbi:hypothetical protein [Aeromonas caviae]|uniref:hypothetical protein n=1 Tax=Aeromonas caviae TaxID=648 RepID=UPI002B48B998|nr:hypothetical protein [Aeromonas caviae]
MNKKTHLAYASTLIAALLTCQHVQAHGTDGLDKDGHMAVLMLGAKCANERTSATLAMRQEVNWLMAEHAGALSQHYGFDPTTEVNYEIMQGRYLERYGDRYGRTYPEGCLDELRKHSTIKYPG